MSVYKLTDLRDNSTNWKINVKILSIWNHPPNSHGEIMTMILHDDKNNRVDATIPQGNYHNPFRPFLKPGTWIHISDFRVIVPQSRVRYSSFCFHIKFIWETSVYPLPELVKRDFFDFIFPIDLKYPCLEDWDYVTDAMSEVTNISAIKKFPFVCRQGETDYESRYVSFELLDNICCELFVINFSKCISSASYNYQPIVAIVRFWRIAEIEGENVLKSEFGCSRIYLNPTNFPEIDIQSYIRGFEDYDELPENPRMEVIEEN
uniref:Similarity to replication protein A1 n=1 Tax=Arabidopsis thaliana TaxID=3702 RepID=Q9FYR5_ARATH|nr:unnamed protein product [Arabidopsis thaliana]